MNYGKKDEDADNGLVKVDRTQVFQEARLFNNSPIQPRQCRILLTKIALLLYTGEKFPTNEATTLFFGISKLFQNKDASLRQMVHLVIKELADSAEDIIMVTSTIMKDTGGSTDVIFRPNAIRALCRIIDATTVQSIERVMKTAIVDKNPSVASAALVSSYHLLPIARDVVRRWQSETQEAAASSKSSGGFSLGFSSSSASLPVNNSTMTQYHAIGLLYQMRMHDRMALVKMVQQFGAPGAVKNPAAIVMLVRLAAQLAEEDQQLRKPMMQLLDGWLRHKSEMVNFEAAKAICDMRDVTDAEDRTKKLTATTPSLKPPKVGPTKAAPTGAEAAASASAAAQKYAEELVQIPEMKEFGGVLKSSPVVELTEAETEYVVSVVKHIFKEHVVLQFEVKNTLPATVLENVSVVATPSDEEELEELFIIEAEKLPTDEPGKIYVAFKKASGEGSMPISTFSNTLKFTTKEIDPSTNEPEESGYDDEYEVAEFDLSGSDYVVPAFASNFNHIWEQVGASGEEAEETLQLGSMKSIAEATEQLAKALSLQPLEGTDVPINQTTHTLKLLGKTVGGGRVVASVRMAYSSKSGVTTKIVVRSEEEGVAALVVASVE
ncbi:hypothetical protein RB593_007252 [Gaeumannomyces tritici]